MPAIEINQTLVKVNRIRSEESRLFSNFQKSYKERELDKASEFLWGSVSKIAHAIGLLYGRKLGKHKELVQFMRDLAIKKNKPKVSNWINAAESLHSNFYHNWMEEEIFEETVRKVNNLRLWLIEVLDIEMQKAEPSYS